MYHPIIELDPGHGPRDHAAPELIYIAESLLDTAGYPTPAAALAAGTDAIDTAFARGRRMAAEYPAMYGLLRGLPCQLTARVV